MGDLRMTHATALVLRAVASGYRYGFDVMDVTGLPSGTVYPVLRRLEKRGVLASEWEAPDRSEAEGRPRRKFYRISGEGADALAAADRRLADAASLLSTPSPRRDEG